MEKELVTISIERFAALIAAYERYKIVRDYIKAVTNDKDEYVNVNTLKAMLGIGEEKE